MYAFSVMKYSLGMIFTGKPIWRENNMSTNLICGLIIAVILFFAIRYSIPHFKGEGACCGGGGYKEKARKPKKLQNVVATKEIYIEGMKCDSCRIRVQNS